MNELKNHAPFPFKAFTGVEWTKEQVNEYNRLQDRINAALNAGVFPDNLINGSHNLFTQFSFKSSIK